MKLGKEILLCWVPSHVGISGNEAADKAAKEALSKGISDVLIPSSDFKPHIHNYTKALWQLHWEDQTRNKLREINNVVGRKQPSMKSVRDDTIIRRARIGHTHLTHKHVLRGEPPPECGNCGDRYTVKHILIDCVQYQQIRRRHFNVDSLKELFDKVQPETIIQFLKDINLYSSF